MPKYSGEERTDKLGGSYNTGRKTGRGSKAGQRAKERRVKYGRKTPSPLKTKTRVRPHPTYSRKVNKL